MLPEPAKSIIDWARWKNAATLAHPEDAQLFWSILRARTAAGYGDLESQLIRLMVWVGATLHHGPVHTRLYSPRELLESKEGWCDQQSRLFCFLAHHILKTQRERTVSVKNFPPPGDEKPAGHTMAEVFYEDDWHLFDVHKDHQTVYRMADGAIASVAWLREHPEVVEEQPHWWHTAEGHGKGGFYRGPIEPLYYELDPAQDLKWPWSAPPP